MKGCTLIELLQLSVAHDELNINKSDNIEVCSAMYSKVDYHNYIGNDMDESAAMRFEQHYRSCPDCLKGLNNEWENYENEAIYHKVSKTMGSICAPSIFTVILKKSSDFFSFFDNGLAQWTQGSAYFAHRGGDDDTSIAFHKKIGNLAVHIELVRKPSRLIDIHVVIANDAAREPVMFEVALFKGSRCIETVGANFNQNLKLIIMSSELQTTMEKSLQ